MARPEGAQAMRAIPKPCRRAVFPRRQLSPLPKIGEGFGEWFEAPSYEEGVGVDGSPEGLPSEKELLLLQKESRAGALLKLYLEVKLPK